MTMTNLDQVRAKFAWSRVSMRRSSDYTNLAKSAPALIMVNGLMQTFAFFMSKDKDKYPHKALAEDLRLWLWPVLKKQSIESAENGHDPGDVKIMECLYLSDAEQLMRATDEALEILRWIRQFAAAHQNNEAP